jgi:hypothetical protein
MGYKDIENRGWRLLNPQRVYIHAGKSLADMNKKTLAWIHDRLDRQKADALMRAYGKLPMGAIIGEADITGCVTSSDSPWFVGPYGFALVNPVLYDKPIACIGRLGLFTPRFEGNVKIPPTSGSGGKEG